MKKIFKILAYLLLGLILLLVIAFLILNKSLPKGEEGETAEALAQRMLIATNKTAWDATNIIAFTFRGEHDHLWDKGRLLAQTEWGDYKAKFNINTAKGRVWENDKEITDPEKSKELLLTAWGYFLNDSYWLNPVAKLYDEGVTRKAVELEDGTEALLVTHNGGGITPGDSYLWILDENYLPKAWQMWVDIIPLGGLETTWEGWTTLSTGAKVATQHKLDIGDMNIPLSNIKAAKYWGENGLQDPFSDIVVK